MKHSANGDFWDAYNRLPVRVQRAADKNHKLLEADPNHPSLHFKKVGRYWSVRAGKGYRAVAVEHDGDFIWFWIGPHDEYERLIR